MITDEMVEAAAESVVAEWKLMAIELMPHSTAGDIARAFVSPGNHRLIRAALNAALAAAWRPIEDAPHNVEVLVCGVGADGFYVANGKRFKDTWFLYDLCDDDFSIESSGHTHFMPLPEPPGVE